MQDEGIYTYIDEDITSVDRTTQLNTPDVVLSANQNDTIHAAATRQLNKAYEISRAVTVRGSSSKGSCSEAFVDADVLMEQTPDGSGSGEQNCEVVEEEENLEQDQPFLKLFSRLGSAKRKGASQSGTDSKPNSKPTSNTKNIKSNRGGGGGTAPKRANPDPPGPSIPAAPENQQGDVSQEDQELIESYRQQMEELEKLDAPSSADTAFNQWAKARQSKLSELKSGRWRFILTPCMFGLSPLQL